MPPQPPEHVETDREHIQRALGNGYLIERELGRGGMATVYLARDVRHRRPVAVKVLHPELSAALGAERFLKEIELTASLQHPHILPLFDSGAATGGLLYYVMPYVEGETLRARLEREQQLPVADAIRIATEVADALDYAHGLGVVHRDIKPENVLLRGGHALVADFGIALAVQQAGGTRMTQTGLSLGTPQYMAPEQAMGERQITSRADIYALGAVTYEMLTGEPPFTGATVQAVIARVMTEEPRSLTRQRPSVPAHVDAAVRTALAKIPADRFTSAALFAAALAGRTTSVVPPVPAPARSRARAISGILGAGALLAAVGAGWLAGRRTAPGASGRGPVRFSIELDSSIRRFGDPAISPDGTLVVYAAEGQVGTLLYARRLSDLAARPLPGTEEAEGPFFSPDGAWVAFYSNGALRKVRLVGGAPVLVTRVPPPASFAGGAWGVDDTIHYATTPRGQVYRVPAAGGSPSPVIASDTTVRLIGPRSLPGGRALLVTASPDLTAGRIAVLDLESGRLRQFGPGLGARYVAGQLIYVGLRGELYSQPFDLTRREPTGVATQLASGLDAVIHNSRFAFDAREGTLIYHLGAGYSAGNGMLTLTDTAGRQQRVLPGRTPWAPRFSPDGRHVAYGAYAPGRDSSDIWLAELETGTTQRLTTDGEDNNDPVWSPDGRRVAYDRNAEGGKDIFVQTLDSGPARPRTRRAGFQWPSDWSRDGNALLFTDVTAAGDYDVWIQPSDGGAAYPYLKLPAHETAARVSPDGRWVAYQSDETGRYEVYVQSYPSPGRKTLISLGGGVNPVWRADGRALYYWKVDQLVAARVEARGPEGSLAARDRTPLFRAPYVESPHAMYDVSPDGAWFVIVLGETQVSRLVVALDALKATGRGGVLP